MAAKFKVEGLKELDAALKELPRAVGKGVLRRALLKAGQPIAASMRAKAPDDPTTGGNDLKNSIGVGTKLNNRQQAQHRKMFKNDKASVEVFVGVGPHAMTPQGLLQEFGTRHHPAQPFARPAWDGGKMGALGTVKTELGNEIMKAAKRQAAKAARIAAKG